MPTRHKASPQRDAGTATAISLTLYECVPPPYPATTPACSMTIAAPTRGCQGDASPCLVICNHPVTPHKRKGGDVLHSIPHRGPVMCTNGLGRTQDRQASRRQVRCTPPAASARVHQPYICPAVTTQAAPRGATTAGHLLGHCLPSCAQSAHIWQHLLGICMSDGLHPGSMHVCGMAGTAGPLMQCRCPGDRTHTLTLTHPSTNHAWV
jgi:hypothetical protein